MYAGEQAAIVDAEVWNRVQEHLNRNGRTGGRQVRNKYSAILKGILRCESCGVGMVHTYTQKGNKLYRYYVCVRAHQQGWNQCATRSVSAPEIEAAVIQQIRAIANSRDMLARVLTHIEQQQAVRSRELESEKKLIERELSGLSSQISTLLTSKGRSHENTPGRLADLQDRAGKLEQRLVEVSQAITQKHSGRVSPERIKNVLNDFQPLWNQMTGREQERFVSALVERVTFDGRGGAVTIALRSIALKPHVR
jgi:site-specific DNA recombinase